MYYNNAPSQVGAFTLGGRIKNEAIVHLNIATYHIIQRLVYDHKDLYHKRI